MPKIAINENPDLADESYPALYLEVRNFDEQFSSLDPNKLLFINDLDPLLSKERHSLMDSLVTRYSGDTLGVIPSCECGHTTGAYQVGQFCTRCFTEVVKPTERIIESTVWMKAPDNVVGFLNPIMYLNLVKLFGGKSSIVHEKGGVNVIDWLLRMPVKNSVQSKYADNPLIQKFIDLGFKRGINNFATQIDKFIELAFTPKLYGTTSQQKSKEKREIAKQWLIDNKEKLFCKHLPLPSRVTFVREDIEKTGYVDRNVQLCIDAVNTMLNIKLSETKINPNNQPAMARLSRLKEDRTALASAQLAKFYYDYVSRSLSKKSGTIRKHIFGLRSSFTYRAVITSNFEPFEIIDGEVRWHHYQDIHLPWGVGLNIFSLHITNKLIRQGYTPREANKLIVEHVNKYHPMLDELMKTVIKEHPYGKFPTLLNRNPTLLIQSIQLLYITKIKPDPAIRTISLSLLVLNGFNADFDGRLVAVVINDSNCWKLSLDLLTKAELETVNVNV